MALFDRLRRITVDSETAQHTMPADEAGLALAQYADRALTRLGALAAKSDQTALPVFAGAALEIRNKTTPLLLAIAALKKDPLSDALDAQATLLAEHIDDIVELLEA